MRARLPCFETASRPLRAAMRWADGMRALAQLPPIHTPDPGFFGMSWKEFAGQRFGGDADLDCEMHDWTLQAGRDSEALAFALSQCSWCFRDDGSLLDDAGLHSAGDGTRISIFPTDAPLKGELPAFESLIRQWIGDPCEPGAWRMAIDAGSAVRAMREAHAEIEPMGPRYDAQAQRLLRFTDEVDPNDPIDRKLDWLVPALAAQREREALDEGLMEAAPSARCVAL